MKLVDQRRVIWTDRAHFLAVASQAIRRILIDHARKRNRLKRSGAGHVHTFSLEPARDVASSSGGAMISEGANVAANDTAAMTEVQLIELNDVLKRLSELDSRQGRVVEMKFFGGMKNEDIAHVLGVSVGTVKNDWRFARAWLRCELERGGE
ncbi:MAG: sigma-70 family RNA polymerase sigma factor, partial [Planctomycetota bacterium]